MSSDKQVLAVVFSEDDLTKKLNEIKRNGYKESDLHVMARDTEHLDNFKERAEVETAEADSFGDRVKSFITGESSVREGIKSLGLSDSETERYTEDIAKGGIMIYADKERPGIGEVIQDIKAREAYETPEEQGNQEFIKSVDNNFDEQEDRFARGETFLQDPTLVKDERHVSFTTQEKAEVQKARGGTSEAEKHTNNDKKYK